MEEASYEYWTRQLEREQILKHEQIREEQPLSCNQIIFLWPAKGSIVARRLWNPINGTDNSLLLLLLVLLCFNQKFISIQPTTIFILERISSQ